MKVLVTGASGFIGREIVSELSSLSSLICEIIKVASKENKDIDFYKINIADESDVKSLESLIKVDAVIHSAGLAHQFGETSREDFYEVNVKGTQNICNLAVKLKAGHFILISSVSVYGKSEKSKQGIDESFVCQPEGFYAESKFEAEKTVREICEKNKLALTILRPATVIGEGDVGNVARLIEAIDKKKFIWIGRGENSKSLIYKKDVAKACVAVLEKQTIETEVFNISAESLTMYEIVSIIGENLDRRIPKIYIPARVLRNILRTVLRVKKIAKFEKLLNTIEKWISEDVFRSEKIKEKYNFSPEVPIREAIKREVVRYKNKK